MVSESSGGFDDFVAGRARSLMRTAWVLTGNWSTAEDLVQTALAKTWHRWDRIRRTDDPEVYVRRVMSNTYASWMRRLWSRELPVERVPDRVSVDDLEVEAALRLGVAAALNRLSRKQRVVVALRLFDDLPEAQVADIRGCPVGTVKSTTAQALARLRTDAELAALAREVSS